MPPAAHRVPQGADRRGHQPTGRVSKRMPLAHGATGPSRRRLRSSGATEIARGYRQAETSASEGRIAGEIARRTRRKSSRPRILTPTHGATAHVPPTQWGGGTG